MKSNAQKIIKEVKDLNLFYKLVRDSFTQKRKTIKNLFEL